MNIWTALIILSTSTSPVNLITPSNKPTDPFSIDVTPSNGPFGSGKSAFHMDMQQPVGSKVERLTGVETNVIVNTPASTSITFQTEGLCIDAANQMRKSAGILSVTCVQTGKEDPISYYGYPNNIIIK